MERSLVRVAQAPFVEIVVDSREQAPESIGEVRQILPSRDDCLPSNRLEDLGGPPYKATGIIVDDGLLLRPHGLTTAQEGGSHGFDTHEETVGALEVLIPGDVLVAEVVQRTNLDDLVALLGAPFHHGLQHEAFATASGQQAGHPNLVRRGLPPPGGFPDSDSLENCINFALALQKEVGRLEDHIRHVGSPLAGMCDGPGIRTEAVTSLHCSARKVCHPSGGSGWRTGRCPVPTSPPAQVLRGRRIASDDEFSSRSRLGLS